MAPYCQWIGDTSDVMRLRRSTRRSRAFLQSSRRFVKDLEEFFFVAVSEDADLRQVEGDDAHVEAAVDW